MSEIGHNIYRGTYDILSIKYKKLQEQSQKDRALLKKAKEVILKLVSSKELYADYADDVLSRIEKRKNKDQEQKDDQEKENSAHGNHKYRG